MSGPLAGLKIIEMAAIGPVPLAGQLMADLGATVIVVDKTLDTTLDKKGYFQPTEDINRRNKKSVAINLKSDEGRDVFLALLRSSEVLIEGFRPGVMEKLSIGPADCQKHNESPVSYTHLTLPTIYSV